MAMLDLRNVLAILLLSVLSSCATSTDAREHKLDTRAERAADLLAGRTDADSLAAAALLNRARHRDRSLALIQQATALAPQRPELLWLQIQICQEEPECDPAPIESRLRSLDGANAAGWLGALSRANKALDEPAKLAALAAISRSERLDVYWTTLVAGLSRATANTQTLTVTEAEVLIVGILAAQAIPAYSTVGKSCNGELLRQDAVLQICRGVARALQQGDSYITEMIGVAIAQRVWPEDSAQWKQAAEARRIFEYRSRLFQRVDTWFEEHADVYLNFCAQNRREQDVFKAVLIAMGENPDPPPNQAQSP